MPCHVISCHVMPCHALSCYADCGVNQDVHVVVGTHALLAKTIEFKRLGLLIVDEEQRFGVTHKERLKKMRAEVDVLTLTATPIPRTLHLSLAGLRELSIIDTPPVDRQAIRTYVTRFDDDLLREAILRELARGAWLNEPPPGSSRMFTRLHHPDFDVGQGYCGGW